MQFHANQCLEGRAWHQQTHPQVDQELAQGNWQEWEDQKEKLEEQEEILVQSGKWMALLDEKAKMTLETKMNEIGNTAPAPAPIQPQTVQDPPPTVRLSTPETLEDPLPTK